MAFTIKTPQLGEVGITDLDIGGPGPFALVGPNAGKYGRSSFYTEILLAYDGALGAAEVCFAQASASITPGQLVQFSCTQDANFNMVFQATPWTGTANSGQDIGVALISVGAGQWVWFQINGFAIVNYGAATAGQTVTGVTQLNNVATVTVAAPHGLVVGNQVTLAGFTPAQYNGSYVVIATPLPTTFTYGLVSNALPIGNATVQGTYLYYGGAVAGKTVSGGTAAGNVATITTATPHGLQLGDTVVVSGATPAAYNGTFVVTAVTSTTFNYNALSAPGGVTTVSPIYTISSPGPNGQVYYSANGAASSIVTASKQLLGTQWAAPAGGQIGKIVLPSWQAVAFLGRPNSQGAIT